MSSIIKCFFILIVCLVVNVSQAQLNNFLTPSDTFNRQRFNQALIISSTTYAGFSTGLYYAWYRKNRQTSFHTFNDNREWNQMDKVGHVYTAYLQGVLCFKGAKWIGMDKTSAIWTGAICGSLFQSTIEVMDGFTEKWGFSWTDIGANFVGIGIYAVQQSFWDEQRIQLKVSSYSKNYNAQPIESFNTPGVFSSRLKRANDLYGSSFPERFLKDYNAQTYWASINVHSFLNKSSKWPKWLNLAIGYGSENMYGGFTNEWEEEDALFRISDKRIRQFYLSFDVDLTKIETDSYFLKSIFSILNIFKYPSPALEINSNGEVIFHFLRF